jgi:hypothetical protein
LFIHWFYNFISCSYSRKLRCSGISIENHDQLAILPDIADAPAGAYLQQVTHPI